MIFVAHSLGEKDAFLARARALLSEGQVTVRYTGKDRWVVTLTDIRETEEFQLQKWINYRGTREAI